MELNNSAEQISIKYIEQEEVFLTTSFCFINTISVGGSFLSMAPKLW